MRVCDVWLLFLRDPMDFAHVAGVSAYVFPSAPPTSDPGSSKGVQLHWGGGIHRGAHHTRPASYVPDPQSQQGTTLMGSHVTLLWIPVFLNAALNLKMNIQAEFCLLKFYVFVRYWSVVYWAFCMTVRSSASQTLTEPSRLTQYQSPKMIMIYDMPPTPLCCFSLYQGRVSLLKLMIPQIGCIFCHLIATKKPLVQSP